MSPSRRSTGPSVPPGSRPPSGRPSGPPGPGSAEHPPREEWSAVVRAVLLGFGAAAIAFLAASVAVGALRQQADDDMPDWVPGAVGIVLALAAFVVVGPLLLRRRNAAPPLRGRGLAAIAFVVAFAIAVVVGIVMVLVPALVLGAFQNSVGSLDYIANLLPILGIFAAIATFPVALLQFYRWRLRR